MDIGSAVGRAFGISEQKLRDLPFYQTSAEFDAAEKLVLDLAVAMSATPTDIPDALTNRLRASFDAAQIVELASAIAWEHYRARFNRALGVRAAGFSEGAYCVLPEPSRDG